MAKHVCKDPIRHYDCKACAQEKEAKDKRAALEVHKKVVIAWDEPSVML